VKRAIFSFKTGLDENFRRRSPSKRA